MTQTGQLDQRIVILRKNVTGQDSTGADTLGTPTTVATLWARVEDLDGRELQAAMQRWATARYKITIRRQPALTLTTTDYITWAGKALDILDIGGPGTRADFWRIIAKADV
jgi:SPP1 family predicted phage head-tail adaptor